MKKWVELTGDESYSFENMLPWDKKSAEFTPPNEEHRLPNSTTIYNESLWSKDGGPLQVGFPNWVNPISSWIALGLEHLGLKNLPGFADGDLDGYAYTSFSLDAKSQTRSSSQSSFLSKGLRDDTNLHVYKNTMAKKILFDDDKKAIGAIVESGGIEYTLSAAREVIVSAGAVSPHPSPRLVDHPPATWCVCVCVCVCVSGTDNEKIVPVSAPTDGVWRGPEGDAQEV